MGRPKPPWNRKNKNPTNDDKNDFAKMCFLMSPTENAGSGGPLINPYASPNNTPTTTNTTFSATAVKDENA